MTVAAMPTNARSYSVQPCTIAACPIVTSSPIAVEKRSRVTWMTVRSWMLVRAPIRICSTSPRITQPNQTLDCGPIHTSPITLAVGASQTSAAISGRRPRYGRMTPSMPDATAPSICSERDFSFCNQS